MKNYFVYQVKEDGEFKALQLDVEVAHQVDRAIAAAEGVEVGSVNWFGCFAENPEKAIEEAIAGGYKFRSPEYMKNLHARLREIKPSKARPVNTLHTL